MLRKAKRDRLYLEQDADLAPLRGKLIATVGVSRLAKGLLVEISCIAVIGSPK